MCAYAYAHCSVYESVYLCSDALEFQLECSSCSTQCLFVSWFGVLCVRFKQSEAGGEEKANGRESVRESVSARVPVEAKHIK